MLRDLSLVGFNFIAFLAICANGTKNVLALCQNPRLADLKIDILNAAEKLKYQSWTIAQMREGYNYIKETYNSDKDIEATLALSDDGINKADLIEKMCVLCITHELSSFEHNTDNALEFVQKTICNEDDKDSFYAYLYGKDGAKDCSHNLSPEQQATLKELKDKYNERSQLIDKIYDQIKACANKTTFLIVGIGLLSAAACYHKPLMACITAQEYKKLALVWTSSTGVLLATALSMYGVDKLLKKCGYCDPFGICKEKIFPHLPITATFTVGLAASVGAGSYVASMV